MKRKLNSSSSEDAPEQDPIALLKHDHGELRRLLTELAELTPRAALHRVALLERVGRALRAHAKLEEAIFYPAFFEAARKADDRNLYQEALEEHRIADVVLNDLEEADPSTDEFTGDANVLKDLVEHHFGEEEDETFPRMRVLLPKQELQRLGAEMRAFQAAIAGETAAAADDGPEVAG